MTGMAKGWGWSKSSPSKIYLISTSFRSFHHQYPIISPRNGREVWNWVWNDQIPFLSRLISAIEWVTNDGPLLSQLSVVTVLVLLLVLTVLPSVLSVLTSAPVPVLPLLSVLQLLSVPLYLSVLPILPVLSVVPVLSLLCALSVSSVSSVSYVSTVITDNTPKIATTLSTAIIVSDVSFTN